MIKSIIVQDHDSSYGGYPAKVVVKVQLPVKEFNKLCPKRVFGYSRDLGNLVLNVNNAVYAINKNIPAYYPSIDSNGSKRAVKGIKTFEFVYFVKSANQAELLGLDCFKFANGTISVKYGQYKVLYKNEI